MFFFKKKEESNDKIEKWLNAVDDAYVKSYQAGNVQALEPYCTRACLSKLAEKVRVGGKEYAGLKRYRHVTWTAEDPQTMLVWIKVVSYDHVKVSRGVIVPVGDDYHERWQITIDAETRLISDIRRVA